MRDLIDYTECHRRHLTVNATC